MRKVSVSLFWIFVTVLNTRLCPSQASELSLTAEPASIKDGLTKTLEMRCSLQPTQARDGTARNRSEPCSVKVNSIVVTRDDTTIASISTLQAPVASGDVGTLTAYGDLTPNVETSYLKMAWTRPGLSQAGIYTCTISVTNNVCHDVHYTETIFISHKKTNDDDILLYITELEERLLQTQLAVQKCENNLKTELGDIRLALNNVSKAKLAVQKRENKLKTELEDIRLALNNVSKTQLSVQKCENNLKTELGDIRLAFKNVSHAVQRCENNLTTQLGDVRTALHNSQSYLQGQLNNLNTMDKTTTAALKRLETGSSSLRSNLKTIENTLKSYVAEEGVVKSFRDTDFYHAGDWNLRRRKVYVKFTKTFSKLPTVICNLEMVDVDEDTNLRIKYYVQNVTTVGFNLFVETWWDTILYKMDVKWRASIP